MAIRAMVLLMTIAVALGGRRGGFISGTGTLTLTSGGNRAGNDEELGDSISLDTLDDAQDLSNTKAKQVHPNDAMCTQSTTSISFPDQVGGKSCCGQTSNDPCPTSTDPEDKQTSHCRDDLSDAAFWVPHSGGRCLKFSKRSALAGQSYIEFLTEGGKDVTITTVGRISTPDQAGKNVGVLGLKRVKCTTDPNTEEMGDCTTFKSAVCLDCSSVAATSGRRRKDEGAHRRRRGLLVSSETERKFTIEDAEIMYDKCVTKAFGDGFVKPAFILENTSGNNGVNDDALKRCLSWIQIF